MQQQHRVQPGPVLLQRGLHLTAGCGVLSWLQEDPDASAVVLLGRLQEAEPDRFSRAHLRTLQRRVKQWRGIMAKKLVYATAGEPMEEPAAMPELALVGVDPRWLKFR